MPKLTVASLIAEDMDALVAFYQSLLGFAEFEAHRGPIYRALDAGNGVALGIHSPGAYDLLTLDGSAPIGRAISMLTFEVDGAAEVEALAEKSPGLGATVVKGPYDTAYGSRQVVLKDPAGNVIRLNAF